MENTEHQEPLETLEEGGLAPGEGFQEFGLCEALMEGIREAGFREPTPIQRKAIPEALRGRDLLGQALTGTGKTTAFGLPSMERIKDMEGLQMLVLTPTRELAAQISSELYRLGHFTGLKPAAFTGGQSYRRQEELLERGVNILVATPGRLIDLMESGHFQGVNPAIIVVDEADEMLDMGFIDDVKRIFQEFPGPHQTMLFSATMPRQVESLARDILHDPMKLETESPESANNDIQQSYFVIEEHERTNAVIRLIESEEVSKAIIFCRTREETDSLNILLGGRGYNVNCLHGDMEQAARARVMAAFRRGDFDILVATDVAARGIDVENVSHVFNYHLPFDSRAYVHRIGRTGRAGKTGKAITLVTPRELRQLEAIRRSVGAKLSRGRIPSRNEVNAQRLEKLLAGLFAASLDTELYAKIQELTAKQDQDPAILFTKMVARQLALTADQGPENIGVTAEKLERLQNQRSYRNRSRYAQRALFLEEREEQEEREERRGAKGGRGRKSAFREYEENEEWSERREPRKSRGGAAKRSSRQEREKTPKPPKAKAPKAQPAPPPPRLNPDGTPMLNRRQRRALKFGNPMPEK
ncbi:MAG: DEAD/DEAH box helicase [Oligosphaeraceae bacterium]